MGQLGFFDIDRRYAALDTKDDPLSKLDRLIPWEQFRPQLEAVWRTPRAERKSPSGRTPWDAIVIFKGLLLGVLYNLSDEQIEYQIRDRLSFARFLGLGVEGGVPDATTFWLYREQLTRAGRSRSCSRPLTAISPARATKPLVDRSSMPRSSPFRSSATPAGRTRSSSGASSPESGSCTRRRGRRKMSTLAGPRNMGRITMATRTTSASTGGTSWCVVTP